MPNTAGTLKSKSVTLFQFWSVQIVFMLFLLTLHIKKQTQLAYSSTYAVLTTLFV
jgi:hypothetical protein